MYSLTVRVPEDSFLPPLPWQHGGALNFPTGQFHGVWTLPELECALARGVEIVAAHAALVWEATAPVFADVMHRWYEIRRRVGRKSPFGQWVSRMSKAITGKLAEKPDRSRVSFHPTEIKVCPRTGPCRRKCAKRCGAYDQLDLFGHIWAVPYRRLGPSAYPQWSAYLRAMTRVQWLEQAEAFGSDLCMGNTDSLWTLGRKSPEPLGTGLGQWEFQGAWSELDARALTIYAAREMDGPPILDDVASYQAGHAVYRRSPGKLHIHGIPGLTEADWLRGGGTFDRGVVTLGRAVKSTQGLFKKRERRWTLPSAERVWYGDRKLGAGGITYPATAQQIREHALERRARRARE